MKSKKIVNTEKTGSQRTKERSGETELKRSKFMSSRSVEAERNKRE